MSIFLRMVSNDTNHGTNVRRPSPMTNETKPFLLQRIISSCGKWDFLRSTACCEEGFSPSIIHPFVFAVISKITRSQRGMQKA
ncbi:hypothetical protein CEXT_741341 [Caerostris extrusa]|uniref:Uncharacterized protein n=1 Tax=Caerostris extrusa TaxID=172846 RepID=A0AAV4M5U8_CAEEX|nr:hypothetical protein CEXT_741341 [Caerostris extrusa]